MKYFFLLLLLYIFSSCTSVYFREPQNLGGNLFDQVPEELQGVWRNEKSTHVFSSFGLIEADFIYDSLGHLSDTTYRYFLLSDSLQLYKSGEYYIANLHDPKNGWEIFILEKSINGNINWYYPTSYPYCSYGNGLQIEKVEKTREIYVEDEETPITETFMDSSIVAKNNEVIKSVYYKGQISSKTMEEIIRPENLIRRYVYNGYIIYDHFD